MNLEEDAMLVAIGRMSMEEAREKWADRWADFCRAFTNWKSVHQLLRCAQLMNAIDELSQSIAAANYKATALKLVMGVAETAKSRMESIAKSGKEFQEWYGNLAKRTKLDKDESDVFAAMFGAHGRGKSNKLKYDWKAEVAVFLNSTPLGMEYREVEQRLDRIDDSIRIGWVRSRKMESELDELKAKRDRAMDMYDATKSYSMGLLVADIFYSMAAAIQGEIY